MGVTRDFDLSRKGAVYREDLVCACWLEALVEAVEVLAAAAVRVYTIYLTPGPEFSKTPKGLTYRASALCAAQESVVQSCPARVLSVSPSQTAAAGHLFLLLAALLLLLLLRDSVLTDCCSYACCELLLCFIIKMSRFAVCFPFCSPSS